MIEWETPSVDMEFSFQFPCLWSLRSLTTGYLLPSNISERAEVPHRPLDNLLSPVPKGKRKEKEES